MNEITKNAAPLGDLCSALPICGPIKKCQFPSHYPLDRAARIAFGIVGHICRVNCESFFEIRSPRRIRVNGIASNHCQVKGTVGAERVVCTSPHTRGCSTVPLIRVALVDQAKGILLGILCARPYWNTLPSTLAIRIGRNLT
jgi:hypothetical protein